MASTSVPEHETGEKYVRLADAQAVLDQVETDVQSVMDQHVEAIYLKEERAHGKQLVKNAAALGLLDNEETEKLLEQYREAESLSDLERLGDDLSDRFVPALVAWEDLDKLQETEGDAGDDEENHETEEKGHDERMEIDESEPVTEVVEPLSVEELDEESTDLDLQVDWDGYEFPVIIRANGSEGDRSG